MRIILICKLFLTCSLLTLIFFNQHQVWAIYKLNIESTDDEDDYILVVGENKPELEFFHPITGKPCTGDVFNVQNAVDNYMNVRLEGEFDFGSILDNEINLIGDGVVRIRKPEVTVRGPATIKNGGGWWQIRIEAPGVKILDLTLLGGLDVGIGINVEESGKSIIISGNTIETQLCIDFWPPVNCGVIIENNNLEVLSWGSGIYAGYDFSGLLSLGIHPDPWIIKNNQIHLTTDDLPTNINIFATGIALGGFAGTIEYAKVKGNNISGNCYEGISLGPYAKNNFIEHNNLSGLRTFGQQIHISGENNKIVGNIFGTAKDNPYRRSVAVRFTSVNWFPFPPFNTPPAWTRNNKLLNNDYRNWEHDDGCILLDPQLYLPSWGGNLGLGIVDNLVAEHKFPVGTNVCDQVVDWTFPANNNKISGWNKHCGETNSLLKKPIIQQDSEKVKEFIKYQKIMFEKMLKRYQYEENYYTKDYINEKRQTSLSPEKFALGQNYPNPFNPITTIKYELPEKSNTVIEIYNIMGEKVEKLIDVEKSAGYHQINFDAIHLTSGIYFYRLQAGDFVETKKMILLK